LLRWVALLAVGVLISACGPKTIPLGLGQLKDPVLTENTFTTDDGMTLAVRKWLPAGETKGVVLALHGFNDYAKAFEKIPADAPGTGAFLSAQGYAVYAYDQRGFGSSPHAGLWPGEQALIDDFHDFAATLRAQYPGKPLYALGESMGGAVIMAAVAQTEAAKRKPLVDGIILAAPAVWARTTMPFYYRIPLWLGAQIMPGFKPSAKGLGYQASDNIDLLRHNARDPLFIKETRVDAVYGMTSLMEMALASPPNITVPTLYLYGAKDQIIPRKPTLQAVQAFDDQAPLKTALYPEGWHIVLRDKEAETVLKDVVAFLDNPRQPLPSGADQNAVERLKVVAKQKLPKPGPAPVTVPSAPAEAKVTAAQP
jgi:alpha-beta hydrolase superfamily lysophospholipase